MRITRRESLGLAIGLGVGACAPGAVLAATTSEADESLNALARRSGRRFGSSVAAGRAGTLTGSLADPGYRALLTGQCGLIVPENELKWGWIRRTPQELRLRAGRPALRLCRGKPSRDPRPYLALAPSQLVPGVGGRI